MLLVLAFGHLATDICQSALPTILPFLKAKLLLSYTMSGVILLASNVTSSVIQPIFGYLSDRKEKLFLLPLGCLCAGLGLSLLSAESLRICSSAGDREWTRNRVVPSGRVQNNSFFYGRQDSDRLGRVYSGWERGIGVWSRSL
jgi:hypothetical protein